MGLNKKARAEMSDSETYPGGFDALLHRVKVRRVPLDYAEDEYLPDLDTDLAPLRGAPTILEPVRTESSFEIKKRSLQGEFEGHPELCFLNAILIANLRKDSFPPHAPALFQKLWAEHGDFLIERLPLRWLVSTIITFGDHGANEAQRTIGRSLTVLFSMIKLYEFERLYSGHKPDAPFSTQSKVNSKLPLGMPSYSLKGGGLDIALLTRLWADTEKDKVIAPLAQFMMNAINEDPATLFRRLRNMADERLEHLERNNSNPIPVAPRLAKTDPEAIEWGVVATANEDHTRTMGFVAYHLGLGADAVWLFFEDDEDIPADLERHPQVTLIDGRTILDPETVARAKRERNARKAYYFNWARRKSSFDWLAMLDTDEFIISEQPLPDILARTPTEDAFLHLPVYEYFAESDGLYRPPASANGLKPGAIGQLYPVFGPYAADLVLGQSEPRLMLRARVPDIRTGNFVVKYKGRAATNAHLSAEIWIAHRHCEDFSDFQKHLHRRINQGYARRNASGGTIRSILEAMNEGDKRAELRNFYTEIAVAREEVIAALKAAGSLRHCNLDLATKLKQFSEDLPA